MKLLSSTLVTQPDTARDNKRVMSELSFTGECERRHMSKTATHLDSIALASGLELCYDNARVCALAQSATKEEVVGAEA